MSSGPEGTDSLTSLHYALAGATAGTITRFILQPLDVLKTVFQLQNTPNENKDKAKYTSMLQALRVIHREQGIPGLWKGHIPAQCLSFVFGAVQFSVYENLTVYFRTTYPSSYTSSKHLMNILCGSLAGLTATVSSFPFDVIRTHLIFQGDNKLYTGVFDVVAKQYKKHGPMAFTKGMAAACIQMAPMSGLLFCFHGIFSQIWFLVFQEAQLGNNVRLSTTGNITTGLLSGLCAKAVVYPFDLMKKRLQIQGYSKDLAKGMIVCSKISECFYLTVRSEGFLGLFKGIVPTVLKSGATTSLYFTIYSSTCQLFEYSLAKR